VIVEREAAPAQSDAYRRRLTAIAKRRPLGAGPFGKMTSEAIMALLRGED
jgi:hypothetical protein